MTTIDPERPVSVMGYPMPVPDPGAPTKYMSVTRKKVTFIHLDDWVGVYVDGKLKQEGLTVNVDDLVSSLGHYPKKRFSEDKAVRAWFSDEEHLFLPKTLQELDECL